jgi:hypothetical protein
MIEAYRGILGSIFFFILHVYTHVHIAQVPIRKCFQSSYIYLYNLENLS